MTLIVRKISYVIESQLPQRENILKKYQSKGYKSLKVEASAHPLHLSLVIWELLFELYTSVASLSSEHFRKHC